MSEVKPYSSAEVEERRRGALLAILTDGITEILGRNEQRWLATVDDLRKQLHDIEANADPAGTVREAVAQRENAEGLAKMIESLRAESAHMADRIRAFDLVLSAAKIVTMSRYGTTLVPEDEERTTEYAMIPPRALELLHNALETYRNQGNAYLPESPLSRLIAAACAESVTSGPLYAAVKQYVAFVKQARESGAPIS